ncbi:hypothetical protein LTR84_012780 [Exophiala bonariae]|uniref:Carboxylic ester hydrolase n=1 Tax=Exophiala bonariae TaxID=1690606 RepID=A0AAV9NJE3_9EURO|nr:hypothetical protein LTR84_012780 [Exophiala bonariae]
MNPEIYGVRDSRFGGKVHHYRGISYATISDRFAKPTLDTNWQKQGLTFRQYGPRCPQPAFPMEGSMCLPTSNQQAAMIEEDEFTCCNLNITTPVTDSKSRWPLYLWIHGGGQSVSFPSAQHRLGDTGPLVAQSIEMRKPIILVTINYRLNIFGFADPEGVNINLDLQDQATAVNWVQKYISLFGGDPENITIGGQSAGAIYTHGLLAMGIGPKRVIMASGSLYLTAPQTRDRGLKLLRYIEHRLSSGESKGTMSNISAKEGDLLRKAPVHAIVKIFEEAKFYSWWMFDAPLGDWKNDLRVFGNVEAVLLSDCRDEGIPYEHRLRQSTKAEILNAFKGLSGSDYTTLMSAYGLDATQAGHAQCVTMATDFVNDARYALWTQEIWGQLQPVKKKVYLCHYDEVNPFGPWPTLGYSVAHHAVDLLAAFGGYDAEVNDATRNAGRLLRGKWIDFINGDEPWTPDMVYCIGPDGKSGPVPAGEIGPRRRYANFEILKRIGIDSLTHIWQQLLPTEGVDTGDLWKL